MACRTAVAPTVAPVRSVVPRISRSSATRFTSGLFARTSNERLGTSATTLSMSGSWRPRIPPSCWTSSRTGPIDVMLVARTMTLERPVKLGTRRRSSGSSLLRIEPGIGRGIGGGSGSGTGTALRSAHRTTVSRAVADEGPDEHRALGHARLTRGAGNAVRAGGLAKGRLDTSGRSGLTVNDGANMQGSMRIPRRCYMS